MLVTPSLYFGTFNLFYRWCEKIGSPNEGFKWLKEVGIVSTGVLVSAPGKNRPPPSALAENQLSALFPGKRAEITKSALGKGALSRPNFFNTIFQRHKML